MLRSHLLRQVTPGVLVGPSGRAISTSAPVKDGHAFGTGNTYWEYDKLCGREVVGFGMQGRPVYQDRYDNPYPAIRWRKDDEVITPIREKEKGDWKLLTIPEKKLLYRYSFARTYAELGADDGSWKIVCANVLIAFSLTMLSQWYLEQYLCPFRSKTLTVEWKEASMQKLLDMYHDPAEGLATLYDYENERWKA